MYEIIDFSEATEVLDQNLGGKRQFAHIKLSVHPDAKNRDFKHVIMDPTDQDNPLELKRWVVKAIENGIKSALSHGCKI